MIVLDGTVYCAIWDGSVEVAPDNETVPFSNVTFFDSDIKAEHVNAYSSGELKSILNLIVRKHGKVTGLLASILVRSELKQEEPYKPLNDALKTDQREFTYSDIKGTIVALYCPDYMAGLNTTGWHLHFISEDRQNGGHVLELALKDVSLEFYIVNEFAMVVPNCESFNSKSLETDLKNELNKVE